MNSSRAVILIVVVFSLFGSSWLRPSLKKRDIANVRFSDHDLKQWYLGFNESQFGNELPTTTQVIWQDLSEYDAKGMTIPEGDGFKIELDPGYIKAPNEAQMVLLHEMCHVEVNYVEEDADDSFNHGPKWYACMVRTADHGGFRGIW